MTRADQTALWDVCLGQWRRLQPRWSAVHLPRADWEDIRSEAFIRVFQQAARYDPAKGAPEVWAATVIYRSTINSLRRFLPDKTRPAHVWRTNLRLARPIRVRVEETGQWGEEVTVVEPDMVDESAADPSTATRWEEFLAELDSDQRTILQQRARGLTLVDIRRRFFARKTYHAVYMRAKDIRRRWREYAA